MASAARIFEVDMLGMDHVLTGLLPLAVDGTVAVCIASMAGYFAALPGSLEHSLAKAPTDELMSLVGDVASMDSGRAYCIAKKVNQLRVAQAAASWGAQGARIVSISPGTISTPMGRMELDQGHGATMQQQLDMSPIHRIGTADDIASAVEWLTGPGASFITGIDLRIDGGITAVVLGMGLFVNPEAG
jgi:NAD(P)-dependent dehydrogenase (short-subunit alcohol dehydrogenase family)